MGFRFAASLKACRVYTWSGLWGRLFVIAAGKTGLRAEMLAAFTPGVPSGADILQSRPEGGSSPCGKEVDGKIYGKNTLTHQRDFACGDIP